MTALGPNTWVTHCEIVPSYVGYITLHHHPGSDAQHNPEGLHVILCVIKQGYMSPTSAQCTERLLIVHMLPGVACVGSGPADGPPGVPAAVLRAGLRPKTTCSHGQVHEHHQHQHNPLCQQGHLRACIVLHTVTEDVATVPQA
jgi:hypothetical protein